MFISKDIERESILHGSRNKQLDLTNDASSSVVRQPFDRSDLWTDVAVDWQGTHTQFDLPGGVRKYADHLFGWINRNVPGVECVRRPMSD